MIPGPAAGCAATVRRRRHRRLQGAGAGVAVGPALSARCVGCLCVAPPSLIAKLYLLDPLTTQPGIPTSIAPLFLRRTVLLLACITVTSASAPLTHT
eukprot:scaffold34277_cov63-Phaeocystis_antarctica.AAC.4